MADSPKLMFRCLKQSATITFELCRARREDPQCRCEGCEQINLVAARNVPTITMLQAHKASTADGDELERKSREQVEAARSAAPKARPAPKANPSPKQEPKPAGQTKAEKLAANADMVALVRAGIDAEDNLEIYLAKHRQLEAARPLIHLLVSAKVALAEFKAKKFTPPGERP